MNDTCVVKCHPKGGLFSQINKVITCMSLYKSVHVDWTSGGLYGEPADGNVWDHLFEHNPPAQHPHDEIIEYPHDRMTGRKAGLLYLRPEPWREQYNNEWCRLRPRPEIFVRARDFVASRWGNSRIVSALVRSTALDREQLIGRVPSHEEYSYAIRQVMDQGDKLYIACDNTESLQWFKRVFAGKLIYHPDTPRSASRTTEPHRGARRATVADAQQCLVEAIILSQTDHFIHAVSNMATAVLYMRTGLESTFIQ